MEVKRESIKQLYKISRYALGLSFLLIVIMLFHVLIDFFYHA